MALSPRKHPVFWGKEPTVENLQLSQKGFLHLKDEISVQAIKNLKSQIEQLDGAQSEGAVFESDSQTLRSLFNAHERFPELLTLCLIDRILQLVRRQLGSDVFLYQCHLNFKKGNGRGGAFAWHSDFAYWHWLDGMESPRALSLVIPLDEHCRDNGPLELLAGSHHWNYCHAWKGSGAWEPANMRHDGMDNCPGIYHGETHPFEKYTALQRPGDLLIMDGNLIHSSARNETQRDRMGLFIVLASKEIQFFQPYSGSPPRPHYISNLKKIIFPSKFY